MKLYADIELLKSPKELEKINSKILGKEFTIYFTIFLCIVIIILTNLIRLKYQLNIVLEILTILIASISIIKNSIGIGRLKYTKLSIITKIKDEIVKSPYTSRREKRRYKYLKYDTKENEVYLHNSIGEWERLIEVKEW